MRRVILYIAASLDGYIAGENGGIDWLDSEAAPDDAGNGYEAFLREIDTIVMGYNTYRQVTEELSPGKWVYAGKKDLCIDASGHRQPSGDSIRLPTSGAADRNAPARGWKRDLDLWGSQDHPSTSATEFDRRISHHNHPDPFGPGNPPLWSAGLPDSFAVDLYPKERQLVGADLSPARPGERGKMI